ncbi:hypothetical protein [Variovorax sp. tm]|uniref:hypothetical protein n=1 Tax=Variovorax atrisoli TaxID=3394203 RepID=UPI003A80D43C
MASNIDRFKADLDKLVQAGNHLLNAMQYECYPAQFAEAVKASQNKEKASEYLKSMKALPSFSEGYQRWYSESQAVVRQLLPDRVADFIRLYEKPKTRKEISYENYRVEDYLQNLRVTRLGDTVVDKSAAIPHFRQQLAILKAAEGRFESSLFDIRQMLQADLLDSEIEAAEELSKYKFVRAAGAVAGVVLERHLGQVCVDHQCSPPKKNPTISDFNDALKTQGAIDVPQWRFVQHLADIRNLCDHSKVPEPTKEQVDDLIAGVKKVTKTVF